MTYKARTTAYERRKDIASQRFFETPEFKKLEKIWYSKLKETGFEDVEDTKNVHGITYNPTDTRSPLPIDTVFEYYRMVGIYAHHAAFESDLSAAIVEAHSQGLSIRDIAAKLNCDRGRVHRRLLRHRKAMLDRAAETHVIDKSCVSREALWILSIATGKNLERFMQISSIFDSAEIAPAMRTEPKGGEYD